MLLSFLAINQGRWNHYQRKRSPRHSWCARFHFHAAATLTGLKSSNISKLRDTTQEQRENRTADPTSDEDEEL